MQKDCLRHVCVHHSPHYYTIFSVRSPLKDSSASMFVTGRLNCALLWGAKQAKILKIQGRIIGSQQHPATNRCIVCKNGDLLVNERLRSCFADITAATSCSAMSLIVKDLL